MTQKSKSMDLLGVGALVLCGVFLIGSAFNFLYQEQKPQRQKLLSEMSFQELKEQYYLWVSRGDTAQADKILDYYNSRKKEAAPVM